MKEKMCVLRLLLFSYLLLLGLHPFKAAANTIDDFLHLINKPAVSSIQSPDGDIIDCVLLYQQRAMDHPWLKNHTIQMEPNLFANRYNSARNATLRQMWHERGKCPIGTISVRRTTKADISRAKSFEDYGKNKQGTSYPTTKRQSNNHEYAIELIKGGSYHGSKATLNLWNPFVEQKDEFSLAQMWLLSESSQGLNSIEAGWQVYPEMYGDSRTRFFIFWTSDGYRVNKCYNLVCSGFVQVSNEITLGGSISTISTYGQEQYSLDILILKDPTEGNWWLQLGGSQWVGYWPSEIFTTLKYHAEELQWGGEIVNEKTSGIHTTTQMGSGHFPKEGFGKAALFLNLQMVDSSNNFNPPMNLKTLSTHPGCYYSEAGDDYFFFGGPGYDPINCP